MVSQIRLAVDLAGAVVCPTSHFLSGPRALVSRAPEVTGAADTIRRLAATADIRLVARAGDVTTEHLWWWLKDNRFLERAGLHPRQIVIEPTHVDWAATLTPIAPTHLISAEPGVLHAAASHVPHRILLGADCPGAAPGLTVVLTWADITISDPPARRGRCTFGVAHRA